MHRPIMSQVNAPIARDYARVTADATSGAREWKRALLHSLPVTTLVLGLMYDWFALRDRYFVFLYYHRMGVDSSPFSRVTAGRYWMTALVAAGAVLVTFTGACALLGWFRKAYVPPQPWRTWLAAACPLGLGVFLIVTTVNEPTLSPRYAIRTALATVFATGLALQPCTMAARRPRQLRLLCMDGAAVGMLALGITWVSKYPSFLASWQARPELWMLCIAGIPGLLLLSSFERRVSGTPEPGVPGMLMAGAQFAYLFLPLLHHLAATNGYFYISATDNFFAHSSTGQLLSWAGPLMLAFIATSLRRQLA